MQIPVATPAPSFQQVQVGTILEGVYPGAKALPIVTTAQTTGGMTREAAIAEAMKLSLGADKPGVAVAELSDIGTYEVYEIGVKDAKTGAITAMNFEGIDTMAGAAFPHSNLRREVVFVDGNTVFAKS